MRMISFNRRYVAGPESNLRLLDPQSDSLSMLGTQLQGIHEPPHDKTNRMAIAPNEDTDQPAHPPSLIRVFAVHLKKHWVLSYPLSALQRLWSDWADLRWAQRLFVGFIMSWLTFRKCILIFASGLRNKPHFWRPFSLALWLQSQGSLPATYWLHV